MRIKISLINSKGYFGNDIESTSFYKKRNFIYSAFAYLFFMIKLRL